MDGQEVDQWLEKFARVADEEEIVANSLDLACHFTPHQPNC